MKVELIKSPRVRTLTKTFRLNFTYFTISKSTRPDFPKNQIIKNNKLYIN